MHARLPLLFALCAVGLAHAQRLSPEQLQAALEQHRTLTLIDLRPLDAYARGTLPNALHMSPRQAIEKGITNTVVFFDDGLGVNRAKRAVAAFAASGQAASELAGGFAAWSAAGLPTTERKGLTQPGQRYVTYQDLAGALTEDADNVVLVDVRDVESVSTVVSEEQNAPALDDAAPREETPAVTNALDLATEFPAYRVKRLGVPAAPSAYSPALGAPAAESEQPLYVLIDAGDGKAEKKAATMRAAGCARVVVLAGGETIIRRKGLPGLLRRGPGTGLASGRPANASNLATLTEEVTP